jgi:anti-anti-sigma regulatory factor
METHKLRWSRSLNFKGLLLLVLVALGLIVAIVVMMSTQGKQMVRKESSRLMEQIGNNIVAALSTRIQEIAGLTRTLATAVEQLEQSEELFKQQVPRLIDFNGDMDIAGGGVWPEPFAFDPQLERRSFLWSRLADGSLQYLDDYNQEGAQYHNEEWYVVVRHLEPGRCSWSRSYTDQVTDLPMVTGTVATYRDGQLSGTVTIDLELEGLQGITEHWQKKTGGYVFIADQYNKLITFPDPKLAKRYGIDDTGHESEEFLTVAELAEKESLFFPIANVIAEMNAHVLRSAREMPGYDPTIAEQIEQASDQINTAEANLLAAIITDPLARSTFFKSFEIDSDVINQERSIVYTFFVPQAYWKVVIVTPVAEAYGVASSIVRLIIIYLVIMIVPFIAVAYLLLDWFFMQPLAQTTSGIKSISALVADKKIDQLEHHRIKAASSDEVGLLASLFNSLVGELENLYETMTTRNENLVQQINERKEAETALLEANQRLELTLAERSEELKRLKDDLPTGVEVATSNGEQPPSPGPVAITRSSALYQIWESVMLLVEAGPLTEQRVTEIIDAASEEIKLSGLKYLILDLRSLRHPQPAAAASQLAQLSRSLRVMGADPILVGVPVAVAKVVAANETGLEHVSSFTAVQDGLCHALAGMSYQVSRGRVQ